ncbi:peptidase [Hypoxylon cercidicola]|nr:peptidase [Hypoxylon cercidicola]
MAPIITPKALEPGATVAFISPSARLNNLLPAVLSRATAMFEGRGYNIRKFFTPDTGIQFSIADRLSELRAAFSNPAVSVIICTIGGPSFTELLPALIADTGLHDIIRTNPKIVRGEPRSVDDKTSPLAFCVENLFRAVADRAPIGDIPRSLTYTPKLAPFFGNPSSVDALELAPSPGWIWIRPGKAEGRIFGGCLTVMARLAGVRAIAPDWRGRIVFFETAIGEDEVSGNPLHRVRAGIADLIAQGVFEEAAGLVVGRPFGYDSAEMREQYTGVIEELLCEERLAKKKFPILFSVDIGHTSPMVTLPFDALASLDSEKDQFTILEPGVI